MAELLITSSIDPIREGQVFEEGLPRHVTIWQDFTLPDAQLDDFIIDAEGVIKGFLPLEFIGADEALYGPENTVPVRRVTALGRGATAIALHTVLGISIARHDGTPRNPEWAYEGYNPHVTYVDGKALDKNEYVRLGTVELIQRLPENPKHKAVRKLWELTGDAE